MNPLRVLLVEDHGLVRAGFRALLQGLPDVQVVAEAGDGNEALTLIAEQRPDVVLMDITIPGLNGLEATSQAVRQFPALKVIILSMHADEEYVLQALRVGAVGYLVKDAAPAELEIALRAVVRGASYLSPPISRQVVQTYLQRIGENAAATARLTPRQREILQLIAAGRTTAAIAQALHISVKTVETHRTQLMERLNIHDIAGLVRYAIAHGFITLDS